MCVCVCSWSPSQGHHSIASLWAFQSCLNCFFFLHLHGGAQDFVEILMVLWPRFEACACRCVSVCICVRCVSLTPASRRYAVMWGMNAERKCRASKNLWQSVWDCFTPPKRNNEVTDGNAADKCARFGTFEFQCFCCVWLFTPLIYTFMRGGKKNVPLRIFVCEKLLSVNNQKTGKLNRQESQKKSGIIMSWITCCIDSTDGGKQLWLFYFTLPACCCAPATLFCC